MDVVRTRLAREQWLVEQRAHQERVQPWTAPRLERRSHGERHPVDDFLFEYYSFRPAQLARWHPGPGVALEGPADHLTGISGFAQRRGDVFVDPQAVGRQSVRLPSIKALLVATAGRRARLGCSALHEWAMIHRVPATEVRHAGWPLRLDEGEIARTVERVGLRCTHFDAFRFFAPQAVGRNESLLTRAGQPGAEQPGCLHATMDLYKWAYLLSPLVPAILVADAFGLARDGRELDMRASPYDLSDLGFQPVRIETPDGRREYADRQRAFTERAAPLRERLVDRCDRLLAAEPG